MNVCYKEGLTDWNRILKIEPTHIAAIIPTAPVSSNPPFPNHTEEVHLTIPNNHSQKPKKKKKNLPFSDVIGIKNRILKHRFSSISSLYPSKHPLISTPFDILYSSPYWDSKTARCFNLTPMESGGGEEKHVYSVWGLPPEDLRPRLKKLMESLRSEFNGPEFDPHVTVVGALSLTESEARDKFFKACEGLKAYRAKVVNVDTGSFFYQCVFLLLDPTPEVILRTFYLFSAAFFVELQFFCCMF